jgi:hypothetical protein
MARDGRTAELLPCDPVCSPWAPPCRPATPERNVNFDINDFDETLPARRERDVKRLAASIVLAARSIGLSDSKGRDCAVAMTRSHRKQIRRCSGMNPLRGDRRFRPCLCRSGRTQPRPPQGRRPEGEGRRPDRRLTPAFSMTGPRGRAILLVP